MGTGEGISVRLEESGKDVEGKKFQGRRNSIPRALRREQTWGTERVKRKPADWDAVKEGDIVGDEKRRHPVLPGPRRLGRGTWYMQSAPGVAGTEVPAPALDNSGPGPNPASQRLGHLGKPLGVSASVFSPTKVGE